MSIPNATIVGPSRRQSLTTLRHVLFYEVFYPFVSCIDASWRALLDQEAGTAAVFISPPPTLQDSPRFELASPSQLDSPAAIIHIAPGTTPA